MLTGADRKRLLLAALGYFAFVVYGSLVPLHFRPAPLLDAWERFESIPYLNLGIGSRADWVANILLFVPLAFLWLGVLWPHRGRFARSLASFIVLAGCVVSSVAIEFTQVFFPPRTVSMNDLVAESLGAIIGIVLWWTTGQKFIAWISGWAAARTRSGTTAYLLTAYMALVFGYNLMPLDLTISVVEIWLWPNLAATVEIAIPPSISTDATKWLDRAEARCLPFGGSVSSARPPNRTCEFPRIRLSTSPCQWVTSVPLASMASCR